MTSFRPLTVGVAPTMPEPESYSFTEGDRRYELQVIQQPMRARMCGFGDKDRRPITPPPCIRLAITDVRSGKEIDCNDIDHGMFVLNVDLWNEDGSKEVNLVRHATTSSPTIGTSHQNSYGNITTVGQGYDAHDVNQGALAQQYSNPQIKYEGQALSYPGPTNPPAQYNAYPGQSQIPPYSQPQFNQAPYTEGGTGHINSIVPTTNNRESYQSQSRYSNAPQQPTYYSGGQIHQQGQQPLGGPVRPMPTNDQFLEAERPLVLPPSFNDYSLTHTSSPLTNYPIPRGTQTAHPPTGMFTRNLIGSLACSAFRLTDPNDRIGIWFVLQDLSVRTEGNFRLRFSFVNVGLPPPVPGMVTSSPMPLGNGNGNGNGVNLNTKKAPILAACFSEVFTVFSAKKFPGVVESTNLSKCFATQGIKIPIRKDGGPGRRGGDDAEED